jgi:hypothetical protein
LSAQKLKNIDYFLIKLDRDENILEIFFNNAGGKIEGKNPVKPLILDRKTGFGIIQNHI